VWVAKYQIYIRPFKSALINVLSIFNECFLVMFTGVMFYFLNPSDDSQVIIAGFTCIGMLGFFFAFNWSIVVVTKVIDVKNW
jgi:hypothetical protein